MGFAGNHSSEDARIVQARSADGAELVRYATSGKWYDETPGRKRKALTVAEAAVLARDWQDAGGVIYLGLDGGSRFDRKVSAVSIRARR